MGLSVAKQPIPILALPLKGEGREEQKKTHLNPPLGSLFFSPPPPGGGGGGGGEGVRRRIMCILSRRSLSLTLSRKRERGLVCID